MLERKKEKWLPKEMLTRFSTQVLEQTTFEALLNFVFLGGEGTFNPIVTSILCSLPYLCLGLAAPVNWGS